jgi:hypothetical protein
MKTFFFISVIFSFCTSKLFGQDSTYLEHNFYLGANLNTLGYWNNNGNGFFGFGIEGGFKNTSYYFGLEYGAYPILYIPVGTTASPVPIPRDDLKNAEQYVGIDGGMVIRSLWLGIVLLYSYGTVNHYFFTWFIGKLSHMD